MSEQIWTYEIVEEWLQIATQVERVLPKVGPKMATPHLVYARTWIELLWDELDPDFEAKAVFQPTNTQVSMWEEVVLRWLPQIDSNADRKILWWRSCQASWVRIAKRLNIERHTVANRYKRAVDNLVRFLNSPQYQNTKRNT